ncbi:MAG: hypothetical protein KAR20_04530, partial [Candidatus Heimdallarchaeota archaeon]|nr:hypothetical protein [Candidatus Heimdallarchaeota archaeon]
MENDEFGGLTGGQGHLSTLLGGAYRHIWTSGVKDAAGTLTNPYSAVSVPLLGEDDFASIEKHMMLVQAGKEYADGKAVVARTASLVNNMWTDLLRDKDEVGVPLHESKLGLTVQSTRALQQGDFKTAADVTIRYVEIRDQLVERWLNLMLDANNNQSDVPEYAQVYAQKVFDINHPEYADYQVVRDIYDNEGEEALRTSRLYTFNPIADLVENAKREGIAVMPLGAGGPGANLIAIDPKGIEHLKQFLASQSLDEIREETAREIINGTGELKGFMDFKVGKSPMSFDGFEELEGVTTPQLPGLWKVMAGDVNLADLDQSSSPVEPGKDVPMSEKDFDRLIREYKNLYFARKIIAFDVRIRGGIEESSEAILLNEIRSRQKKLSGQLDGVSSRSDGLFVMGGQYKDMGSLFMWSKKIFNKEVAIPRAVARIFEVNDTGVVIKYSMSENPKQFFEDLDILEKA